MLDVSLCVLVIFLGGRKDLFWGTIKRWRPSWWRSRVAGVWRSWHFTHSPEAEGCGCWYSACFSLPIQASERIHPPSRWVFSLWNLTGNMLTDTLRSSLTTKISRDTVITKLFHGSRPVFLRGWWVLEASWQSHEAFRCLGLVPSFWLGRFGM